jgi:hypothetical protein
MPVIEVVQKVWVPEVPDIELPYAEAKNARLRVELERLRRG